jgi:hypothetical protein
MMNDDPHTAVCDSLTSQQIIATTDDKIEVGAAGDDLRYWQAKEALRQAELRLGSQASTLQAFEARSTSILGWLVAVLTTIAGAAAVTLNGGHAARAAALCVAFVPATIAIFAAAGVVWPKKWSVPGYEPPVVLSECENELQQTEFFVQGYATGIRENAQFLAGAGERVRRAWWGLMLTPPTGAAACLIAWAVGG